MSLIWGRTVSVAGLLLLSHLVEPSFDDGGDVEADQESDDPVSDHHVGIELHEHRLGEQLADVQVDGDRHGVIDIRF